MKSKEFVSRFVLLPLAGTGLILGLKAAAYDNPESPGHEDTGSQSVSHGTVLQDRLQYYGRIATFQEPIDNMSPQESNDIIIGLELEAAALIVGVGVELGTRRMNKRIQAMEGYRDARSNRISSYPGSEQVRYSSEPIFQMPPTTTPYRSDPGNIFGG